MKKLGNIKEWEISRRTFWVLAACVFAAKAILGWQQNIYIWVGGAPLDDELMYRAAQSITAGRWLGAYNYLTLSKQMFFAVWLAFCHAVHLPYLIAGQLLGCGAALAMAGAFAPVLKKRLHRFLLFALLAFSPAAGASFTLRVYRDNIFPAECLLLFAGLTAVALRWRTGVKSWWGWLVLAGAGFGLAKITREDGVWLAPFAILGTVIILIAVWREKGFDLRQKALRSAALALPFALLAACVCAMSAMNLRYYGVFTTSDFSEGSFAAAYGAMTRIEHENDDPQVPVPADVREKLYEAVPALAQLRPWLEENDRIRNGYLNADKGDYMAGSFYWVLRRAAQEAGVYDTAAKAAAYWQGVADAINAAIADGTLTAAYGPRSTTTPVIKAYYIAPTLAETARSVVYCATFQDCKCYYDTAKGLSLATPEDAAAYAAYLGSSANYAAVENGDTPYYAGRQLLVYRCFDALRWVYAVLVPVLLCAAAVLQLRRLAAMIKARSAEGLVLWLVLLGLLGMALLRCAMIAFMEVSAFNIGTYVMYLSTVHPLLIAFGAAGVLTELPHKKGEV